jgi:hypothetical protein
VDTKPSDLLELRSKQEIVDRCREIIHRFRRRFLKKNSRPCPLNCQFGIQHGNEITGCSKCESYNPDRCMRPEEFVPLYTREELAQQFREELFDRQILFRRYPAVAVLLWVLGVVKTAEDEIHIDADKMKDLEKTKHANAG